MPVIFSDSLGSRTNETLLDNFLLYATDVILTALEFASQATQINTKFTETQILLEQEKALYGLKAVHVSQGKIKLG